MVGKKCEVYFRSGERLSNVLCTGEPCAENDSWRFVDKNGLEIRVQYFEAIFECVAEKVEAAKT
jgi:hypothetical protein